MNEPTLHYLERLPTDHSGGPHPPLVILLHGRGAEAKVIHSIEGLLDKRLHIVAITAPYDSEINGREWFRPREAVPGDIRYAEQFAEAERILTGDIHAHCARLAIDQSRIFLWGFSQGAAMAAIIGLRGTIRPLGVIPMAGFLPTPVRDWGAWDTHSRFLFAHGTEDEVLAPKTSLDAIDFLTAHGVQAEYHAYRGRHKMTMDSIRFINEWIVRLAWPAEHTTTQTA